MSKAPWPSRWEKPPIKGIPQRNGGVRWLSPEEKADLIRPYTADAQPKEDKPEES